MCPFPSSFPSTRHAKGLGSLAGRTYEHWRTGYISWQCSPAASVGCAGLASRCHRIPQPDGLAARRSSDPDLDRQAGTRLKRADLDRLGDGRKHGDGVLSDPGCGPRIHSASEPGVLLAAVSLILGLATRVGAATLLALAVASHIRVAALDLNLFWIALLAYYVLLGADRLSLDRLVSQGLKSSSLPQVGALITVLDAARPALTSIYLLALRVALMLTLLVAGGHMSTVMMTTTAGIFEWLPVSSATLLFGEAGIALALLIGSGLATRATALLAVVMFGYHTMSGGEMSFPFYWTVLLLLLVAKGPG